MENTKITSHLNEKIVQGQNLIYCSTMQLAWNELCKFVGGDICFPQCASPETSLTAKELNEHPFTTKDLNVNSYVTMADTVKNGVVARIKKELKEKFDESSKVDFSRMDPDDIVAYAFLLKVLEFEEKFEDLKGMIFTSSSEFVPFMNTHVQAFGVEKVKIGHSRKLLDQVKVLHYKDLNEFTISLKTKSNEFITLARMEPSPTLQDTLLRMKRGSFGGLDVGEVLKIPKISFDLEHHFHEWISQNIYVGDKHSGYFIGDAVQFIKFDLDEEGAKLRSEAALTAKRCISFEASCRRFVFDGPFLIVLRETENSPPYFVAWIENP